jgi:hypothetical protein
MTFSGAALKSPVFYCLWTYQPPKKESVYRTKLVVVLLVFRWSDIPYSPLATALRICEFGADPYLCQGSQENVAG